MSKTWLIDIGNSTVLYCEKTTNGFGSVVRFNTALFDEERVRFPFKATDDLIISSVVPSVDPYFFAFSNAYFLTASTVKGISVNVKVPGQIGADRLANALGAFTAFQQSCLIIDSGTALTFCYVDRKGIYQGGSIIPGMGIASQALQRYTAKIPLIHVQPQTMLFGKTTEEAVQVGLYNGYFHLVSGIISDYRSMDSSVKVIGTGTGLDIYENRIDLDHYIPDLILNGLSIFSNYLVEC